MNRRSLALFLFASLFFTDWLRIGPIKLNDILFLFVLYYLISGRHEIAITPRFVRVALVILFIGVIIAEWNLTLNPCITVLGGWDHGLESHRIYPFVAFVQLLLYFLGGRFIANEVIENIGQMLPKIIKYLLAYQWFFLFLYFVPWSRDYVTNDGIFLRAGFTEKGPYASYLIFGMLLVYTIQHTYSKRMLTRSRKINNIFYVTTIISLILTQAYRILPVVAAFWVGKMVGKNLKTALKYSSIILISAVAVIYLFPDFLEKIIIYLTPMDPARAMGRYAGLIVFARSIHEMPLFGWGTGSYIFLRTSSQYGWDLPLIRHDAPDNFYLQTIIENGWIFGFLIIWCLIFIPIIKSWKKNRLFIFPFALAFAVYPLDGVMYFNQFWVWFCFLMIFIGYGNKEVTNVVG
jgi:hypothetical protein